MFFLRLSFKWLLKICEEARKNGNEQYFQQDDKSRVDDDPRV